ncbi:MAG: hypothetical protein R2877_04190 [Bdellovibrionota bacterium]
MGVNHRVGLYDQVLIKDNHIAAMGGNVLEATQKPDPNIPPVCVVEIQYRWIEAADEEGFNDFFWTT